MQITVGSDPELFVQRRRHFLSAHPLNCGTKETPQQTPNGSVQIDGIALEFNTKPASTRAEFIHSVQSARRDAEAILYDYDPMAKLVNRPSIFFGRSRLSRLPPENSMLGCTPDYDAYTMEENDPPDQTQPFRTGSGHIHVGFTSGADAESKEHLVKCGAIAREMDYFLGLPSLLWDNDNRRRKLYGKAGAFRPKSYGLEYRVLSNRWVDTDKHVGWVFDATVRAVESALGEGMPLAQRFGWLAKSGINQNCTDWPKVWPYVAEEVLK